MFLPIQSNLIMLMKVAEQLTKLLRDPIIVRIVSIIDIASLSILELLEYDLTRRDINYALSSGVLET
jgi:hypothetical protein